MGSGGKGGKKGGQSAEIPRFHLSAHLGICMWREGTELLAISVGEKEAWRGAAREGQVIAINKPDLFGGDKREGGLIGSATWLPGDPQQTLRQRLATRLGLTTETAPGFRGFCSIFFTGGTSSDGNADSSGPKGFYWSANNPYLKPFAIRMRGRPLGLNPSIALIDLPDDSKGNEQKAANPAHIIFEALTNRQWGKGGSLGSIDILSFERAAQTLYNENFGLALMWRRQSAIENFITEVQDHIQAVLFEHPRTGKLTINLLRDDYDPETVPEINPSNAVLTNFERKAWGEIANEVVVTWTNPETEKEETVVAQDLAAIATQGGVVSASRNYYAIRSQELAFRVAQRDLAAMVHPIASCDAELDRSNWFITPGMVVKLNWPEHGINSVMMRVGNEVNRGSSDSGKITVKLQEDIFGLPAANYSALAQTIWTPGADTPLPLVVKVGTAPAYLAYRTLGLSEPADLVSPAVTSALLPVRPGTDYSSYEIWTPEALATGTIVPASLGDRTFPGTGTFAAALVGEAETVLPPFVNFLGVMPAPGEFIVIGNEPDADEEIVIVQTVVDDEVTVSRGVLDTVPRDWAPGTRFWVIGGALSLADATERAFGEEVEYRLLPRTSAGQLAYDDAPDVIFTLTNRPYLPLRPANVQVEGVAFGTLDADEMTEFSVTWVNRNRLVEATQVLTWTDATVALESSAVVRIDILDDTDAVVWTSGDLTGTSTTLEVADFDGLAEAWIEVYSVRGGLRSLQAHRIHVINIPTG